MPRRSHLARDATVQQDRSADALIRRLCTRYLLVLGAIAGLIALDQAIIQPLLIRMDSYAPVINLAGRQRMLSQRLAKAALAVQLAEDPRRREGSGQQLDAALREWTQAHDALRNGSDNANIPRIVSADLSREWSKLDSDFIAIATAARKILQREGPVADAAALVRAREPLFLARMDRIVGLFEQEAAQEIRRLRACAIAIAAVVITLLVGIGWFVVWPAAAAIRRQVDELEVRVAQRTQELAETVASLRHEVAERKLAERRSQLLAAQLAHADRVAAAGHLAIGLAHELNQPLGAIANYSAAGEIVARSASCELPKLQEYLRHISGAALRAGEIVRRIRRFVAPRDSTDIVEVDLRVLIRDIVEFCKFEIRSAAVETALHLGDQRAVVSVDPIQIQQVLVNLVQNALQSLRTCTGGSRRLALELEMSEGMAEVSVIDSGGGFGDADSNDPFESFATTKPEGLGVGLSICRTIVEAHAGSIWINRVGVGAHVTFALPLAPSYDQRRILHSDIVCR